MARLDAVFEHPLGVAQQAVVRQVREALLRHTFELHDIGPAGEVIHRIAVAAYIPNIELQFGGDARQVTALFVLSARSAKQVLVWTSSLFFQYLHYHVGRVAQINGKEHQMDWEATQDPQAPARIRRWVETGGSIIERLHINEPT